MLVLQNNIDDASFDAKIETIIDFLLTKFNKKSEIAVVLVSQDEIQQLNYDYRDKNKTTNVLSFPSFVPLEIADVLGDIMLCLDIIKQEALEQSKTINNHLTHMLVHGFLHLLGFDHINDKDAVKMEKMEIEILQELGIANPY